MKSFMLVDTMRTHNKLRTTLLLAFAVSIIGIGFAASNTATTAARKTSPVHRLEPSTMPQSEFTIDGSANPEMIPDSIAYSLLFRLISGRQEETDKGRIRSYIKQIGLGDADIDALIAAAEEFRVRVSTLDNNATQIKVRYHPEHSGVPNDKERRKLKRLQKQKDAIVSEIVNSLPDRLTVDGLMKVRLHVNERVKRKTKIFNEGAPH